jgi:hypothetical protein
VTKTLRRHHYTNRRRNCIEEPVFDTISRMKSVSGQVVGDVVVLDEALPHGATVDVTWREEDLPRHSAKENEMVYSNAELSNNKDEARGEQDYFDEETVSRLRIRLAQANNATFFSIDEVMAKYRATRK